MRSSVWLGVLLLIGCGDDGTPSPDARTDAVDVDAPLPDAEVTCLSTSCALTCDPANTSRALASGPASFLGDADPASPSEVGDGLWHLFVGVLTNPGQPEPEVALYDATATTAEGPYTLGGAPLTTVNDSYDIKGQETPAYLRADAQTEYLYYCGIESYSPLAAHVAALKRVNGGAWTKIGPVSNLDAGELLQCEPSVARDPATGEIVLSYMSLELVGQDAYVSTRIRTSMNPESFPSASTHDVWRVLGAAPTSRLAMSRDPYGKVWRFSYDRGSYPVSQTVHHAYASTPTPVGADLEAVEAVLHAGNHATHLDLHLETSCLPDACPQGPVLQSAKAVYPDAQTVVFFYSGFSNAPALQVNTQRCTRVAP